MSDAPRMSEPLPQPRPDADSAHYWAQARHGKLVLRACTDCGRRHFPPRLACPYCWSQRLQWLDASGEGTVYTYTVMQRAPQPQWLARVPYVVALVDLAEGPRMMANIVGDDALGVAIGERVHVCFEDRDGAALPQFRRSRGT
ncbi:MAG: hypothetical protein GEV05_02645 [Betaproteobacteria bacterium]|nr:hypothetical protein [Betaproteobacteria bacterium]